MNGRVKRALELNFNNLANVMFPPWYNVFKVTYSNAVQLRQNNLHVVDVYNLGGSYVNVETGENFRARVTVCRSVIKRDTCVIALLISIVANSYFHYELYLRNESQYRLADF